MRQLRGPVRAEHSRTAVARRAEQLVAVYVVHGSRDRPRIVAALEARDDADSHGVARMMREREMG